MYKLQLTSVCGLINTVCMAKSSISEGIMSSSGKIGLLTFHNSHNNGSMLQALALQHILDAKYGLNTEIIDFSNENQKNMYAAIPSPKNFKQFIKALVWCTNYRQMKIQFAQYDFFEKKYFHLSSESFSDIRQLDHIVDDYDAFITGSDQVWNIKCQDADDAYYLPFAKDKLRFAYAVSFGANNPFELEGDSNRYESFLSCFDMISVREQNARKWVREATGNDVPVCLDPTMLMDVDEWESLVDIGDVPVIPGKYIFYYCFSITEEIQRFLHQLSKLTDMPVYFMEAKEWTIKTCWRNKIRLIKKYGPDVYLNVVKHAGLFLTSSFHGTAFGTLYRKNFWYIHSDSSAASKDDRATSFLTQMGLMSRYKTAKELSGSNLFEEIDYSHSAEELESLRAHSFDYLESIVNRINS